MYFPPIAGAPPEDFAAAFSNLKRSTRFLQHVPCSLWHCVASDLASAITTVLQQQTPTSWWGHVSYAYYSPLAQGDAASPQADGVTRCQLVITNDEDIAKRVRQKCVDRDIRASLRLLSTSDSVAPPSQEVVVLRPNIGSPYRMRSCRNRQKPTRTSCRCQKRPS